MRVNYTTSCSIPNILSCKWSNKYRLTSTRFSNYIMMSCSIFLCHIYWCKSISEYIHSKEYSIFKHTESFLFFFLDRFKLFFTMFFNHFRSSRYRSSLYIVSKYFYFYFLFTYCSSMRSLEYSWYISS